MELDTYQVSIELPGGGTVNIEPWSPRGMDCRAEVSIGGRMYQVGLGFERADPSKKWRLFSDNISPVGFFNAPDLPRDAQGFVDPEALLEALNAQRPDDKLVKAALRLIKTAVLSWIAAHPREMCEMQRHAMLKETIGLVNEISSVRQSFYDDTTPLITHLTDRWQWTKYYGQRLSGGDAGKWRRALRAAERAVAELNQMSKWLGRSQRKSAAAAA
jgi:hypothetical protein